MHNTLCFSRFCGIEYFSSYRNYFLTFILNYLNFTLDKPGEKTTDSALRPLYFSYNRSYFDTHGPYKCWIF